MYKSVNIGDRIKNRRKEMKITQSQIKKITGISTGNMSDIENGKSLPSAIAIIELSRVLNCSTDWILTGEYRNNEFTSNDIELELVSLFRKLSHIEQNEILEFMEFKLTRLKKIMNQSEKAHTSKEEISDVEAL